VKIIVSIRVYQMGRGCTSKRQYQSELLRTEINNLSRTGVDIGSGIITVGIGAHAVIVAIILPIRVGGERVAGIRDTIVIVVSVQLT